MCDLFDRTVAPKRLVYFLKAVHSLAKDASPARNEGGSPLPDLDTKTQQV